MILTPLEANSTVRIDQCVHCREVWFDVGELNKFADKGGLENLFPRHVPPMWEENKPHRIQFESTADPAVVDFKSQEFSLLQLLGLPAEEVEHAQRTRPHGTVFLILLGFGFTAFALRNPSLMNKWMFHPEEPLNLLSHFTACLIHANAAHYLTNMYFLWLTGDNIEDREGILFLLGLFFGAGIVAHLVYARMGGALPTLGSSGGISALMAYYALAFPKSRLHFRRFYFLTQNSLGFSISARTAAVLFFAVQIMYAFSQQMDRTAGGVNFLSHVVGAGVGLAVWVWNRSPVRA